MTVPVSLWQRASAWRWLVVGAALCSALAALGLWRGGAGPLPSPAANAARASFDDTGFRAGAGAAGAPPSATTAGPSAAPGLPDVFDRTPAATGAADPTRLPSAPPTAAAAQSYSSVVWQSAGPMPTGSISGGGLIAAYCCAGAFSTVLANRGVSSGRHYLELTLSVRPGAEGPDSWTTLGVAATDGQQRHLMARRGEDSVLDPQIGRVNRRSRNGDVFMLAIDADERRVFWGVNGQWANGLPGQQGGQVLSMAAGQQLFPFVNISASSAYKGPEGDRWIANFGATSFRYPMPERFNAYGSQPGARSVVAPQPAAVAALPSPPPTPAPDALMGKSFRDRIVLKGQAVPLPEGTWVTLSHFRGRPDSSEGDAVILGRITGARLTGLVALNAYTHGPGTATGFPAFKGCERDDHLARHAERNDAQGEQRCWWLNHAVGVWSQQAVFKAALGELQQRGVNPPAVLLNVGFRRADPRGFATAFYYFDPEAEQIASTVAAWKDSEWHRSRIQQDPVRLRYAQGLERWGEGWAPLFFASR